MLFLLDKKIAYVKTRLEARLSYKAILALAWIGSIEWKYQKSISYSKANIFSKFYPKL